MSELQRAVNKLVQKEPGWTRFVDVPPRGAKPASVGRGRDAQSTGGGGGGDLVETAYADRLLHPDVVLSSADGFLQIILPPVKQISFVDEDGAVVKHSFAPPP